MCSSRILGYIGGALFLPLLKLPNLSISVLVRNAAKAQKLRDLNLGVKVVEGSPSTDADVVDKLLYDADLVVDAVSIALLILHSFAPLILTVRR